MRKKAFTLVELIIVITILAILATIAFLSLWSYSSQARDLTRQTDLKSIAKSMDLTLASGESIFEPDEKWANQERMWLTWESWKFWSNNFSKISKLSKLPIDPTTKQTYTYLYNKEHNYYILEAQLENGEKYILTNFNWVTWQSPQTPQPQLSPTEENCFAYIENCWKITIIWLKPDCSNLTKLVIPETIQSKPVTVIWPNAFKNNKKLTSVTWNTILEIESEAFINCENLEEINFKLVKNVGLEAFKNNKLKIINLPEMINLWERAFKNSIKTTELTFEKLETIWNDVFWWSRLDKLNLPKLKSAWLETFTNASFWTININTIKEHLEISNSWDIEHLKVPLLEKLVVYDNGIIQKISAPKLKKLSWYFSAWYNDLELDLPELIYLWDNLFSFSSYKSLNIPKIEHIWNNAGLVAWRINNDIFATVKHIGSYSLVWSKFSSWINWKFLKYIWEYAFENTETIWDINFPVITTIEKNAFYNSTITWNINIPKLQTLWVDAFPSNYTWIITIPKSFNGSGYNWPSWATIRKI